LATAGHSLAGSLAYLEAAAATAVFGFFADPGRFIKRQLFLNIATRMRGCRWGQRMILLLFE